jgi:hypothetical protein
MQFSPFLFARTPLIKKTILLSFETSSENLKPTYHSMQWGAGELSPGIRRPWPEADHSSPPSEDFENERSYTCISPYDVTASIGISLPLLVDSYNQPIALKTQFVVLFLVCSYSVMEGKTNYVAVS